MDLVFPIHHVIVVGFHHKKGCQIEFAFPPLEEDLENTSWKYLPTLAMPDGAHKFESDTVYFHLPSLKDENETVFGVACYRQIGADKLKNKSDDITRSTVQKSVCVLSRFPLYGHMQVKMSLITAAYFREGDFDKVSILEEAFHNLNACLTPELLNTPETFVGLSPRDLVYKFRHQIIVLFKLLLLEKKILFRGTSVEPLCSTLLSLISLIPLTLEYGLQESACVRASKSNSNLNLLQDIKNSNGSNVNSSHRNRNINLGSSSTNDPESIKQQKEQTNNALVRELDSVDFQKSTSTVTMTLGADKTVVTKAEEELISSNPIEKPGEVPDFVTAIQMTASDAGLPLQLFTKGYLCHPYLSLHYLDLLTDPRVRGFVIGATNILFKQKKDLVDVIVEMEDGSIEILDPGLRKLVTPTTPDLRFSENIVRQVTQEGGNGRGPDSDNFLDGVGWEGGDEWLRAQFKYYLMCLMRTSLEEEGSRARDAFEPAYLACWQNTHHWKLWNGYVNSEERDTPGIYSLCPGHPCDGNLSVYDMKLRIAATMQSSESGKRLNQAVGKAMASTGKAVGGALTTAKGALSNWWSTVTTTTTGVADSSGAENSAEEATESPDCN